MEIKIVDNGLLICPETEFETSYLSKLKDKKFTSFVKCGQSVNDIIGLKIKIEESKVLYGEKL